MILEIAKVIGEKSWRSRTLQQKQECFQLVNGSATTHFTTSFNKTLSLQKALTFFKSNSGLPEIQDLDRYLHTFVLLVLESTEKSFFLH